MAIFHSFASFIKNVLPLLTPRTSTTGAALLPSGTTAQRPTGVSGHARYNQTQQEFEGFDGAEWRPLGGAATGSNGDRVFFLNEQTVDANYTIPVGLNAGTFGPVVISNGVTVTIPDGSTYTVV